MNGKKALLMLVLASLFSLTGCISSDDINMMKAKFGPAHNYSRSWQNNTGKELYGSVVDRSVGVDIVLTGGYVDVIVKGWNNDFVYQATVTETTTLVVEVPERGMYDVKLDQHDFTGSYTIYWSN